METTQTLDKLLLSINDPNSLNAQTAITAPVDFWTPGGMLFCATGLSILIVWLLRYGGFSALRQAPVRRNRLFGFEAIVLFSVWLFSTLAAGLVIEALFAGTSMLLHEALTYSVNALLDIGLIAVMAVMAHFMFAHRLKGFGLRVRMVGKDVAFALIYLLAVYPLILFSLWVVLSVGRFIAKDFDIQVHQSLTFLAENGNPALTMLVVITVLVIVPIFEEMLFRGFFQTTIRSATHSPWSAIILTSVFFAFMHYPNWTHMLALFFLSCGLGYAYERSGSLTRSILMHIFFNGISVSALFLAN